jgi:uncharacterized protein YndB with AHSA1/START domain
MKAIAEEKDPMSTGPRERSLVVARVFDAPIEQVWKAWKDPD